jgi:tryptophan halogenase
VSWVQVMLGQHIVPQSYHPLVDQMSDKELAGFMASVSQVVSSCVDAMPMHQAFIDRHCVASGMAA